LSIVAKGRPILRASSRVGCVIGGQPIKLSQLPRGVPRSLGRFIVYPDWKRLKKTEEALPKGAIDPSPSFRRQQSVEGFERPELWRGGALIANPIKQGHDSIGLLVLETPGQSYGVIDNEGHLRPSLTKSLIDRPPRESPRLAVRSPSAAARALARLNPDSRARQAGNRLAPTGDNHLAAAFDLIQQGRQAVLRFKDPNSVHGSVLLAS